MVKGKHSASCTDKANKPKKERNYKEISWHQCQSSGSSQIPSQDDLDYHQFLSLYSIVLKNSAELHIYDTENEHEEVKILDNDINLDGYTSITQLPNGELFCYGSSDTGTTVIIDRSYRVTMLPPGTPCFSSSALYFNNNIYCFGGYNHKFLNLSRKFDLKNNRWIELASLPEGNYLCHSMIFNENILISGRKGRNLWLYSIEIDSFSIIPYNFSNDIRKVLINVERLYLIEWNDYGYIYESEDEYHWKRISKIGRIDGYGFPIYCLYNKEKIYISESYGNYYLFDLRKKVLSRIN